jgi:hypothetical protein
MKSFTRSQQSNGRGSVADRRDQKQSNEPYTVGLEAQEIEKNNQISNKLSRN